MRVIHDTRFLFAILQTALLTKHFVCDFVLQSKRQLMGKARYGDAGGIVHAALHAGGTMVALALVGTPVGLVGGIAIGDGLVHYHVDWIKARALIRSGWTVQDNGYWALFGADQLLHGLTYVAIGWFVCGPG